MNLGTKPETRFQQLPQAIQLEPGLVRSPYKQDIGRYQTDHFGVMGILLSLRSPVGAGEHIHMPVTQLPERPGPWHLLKRKPAIQAPHGLTDQVGINADHLTLLNHEIRRIIVPAQGDVAVAIAWGGKTENEREHQSRSAQGGRQKTRVQQR